MKQKSKKEKSCYEKAKGTTRLTDYIQGETPTFPQRIGQ